MVCPVWDLWVIYDKSIYAVYCADVSDLSLSLRRCILQVYMHIIEIRGNSMKVPIMDECLSLCAPLQC